MVVKRAAGKVYKSTIMQRKARAFETNLEETPGFKQYLTPQHVQTTRPQEVKLAALAANAPYERAPSYRALRDIDAGRSPSSSQSEHAAQLNSNPSHKPLDFIHELLHTPPHITADGPGALTDELALQMVTHTSHTEAHRGASPHNLRLSFQGRRVLELHLQLFLLHAAQQEGKKASPPTALLDTQRKVSVTEEDADVVPPAAVLLEAEVAAEEEAKPDWEHPTVPSFASSSPPQLGGGSFGRNRWRVSETEGVESTPGKLAEDLVDEPTLGYLVGRGWNVDRGTRYATASELTEHRLNSIRGSVVQSIFGGASHAYGVGFTSRLFHSRALPLMKDRLPEWTWQYVEEQRLKVLAEGGLWGGEGQSKQ